jgi:hypothetical protein
MSVLYLADTVGIDGTVYPTIGEHTTTLTSENEISVEYIADTEAYIDNIIKETIH